MEPSFRTKIQLSTAPFVIDQKDPITSVGSCFAVHLTEKLQQAKFSVGLNPFGILFNPSSIATCIDYLINPRPVSSDLLIMHEGLWHSLLHHGRFSSSDQRLMQERINREMQAGHQHLIKSKVLVITLGTAFAYKHLDTETIVANCHKIPQRAFKKVLLSVDQIIHALSRQIRSLSQVNEELKIIFTLSPVRYQRDGLVQSQRSKATLLLAIHDIVDHFDHCHYFPAYEIILDDLRDYRFYHADMLHPNEVSIAYVMAQFTQMFMSEGARDLLAHMSRLHQSLNHRPLHSDAPAFEHFKQYLRKEIDHLADAHPDLDFSEERARWTEL